MGGDFGMLMFLLAADVACYSEVMKKIIVCRNLGSHLTLPWVEHLPPPFQVHSYTVGGTAYCT
jgi:hypothetical protein